MADGQAEAGQVVVELRAEAAQLFAELQRARQAVEKTTSLMGHQTRLMVKGFDGVNKSILSVVQALGQLKAAGSGAATGVVSSTKAAQSGLAGYIASLERAVRSLQSSRAAHLSVADATANATAAKKTANQANERTIATLLREEASLKRVVTAQHALRVLQESNLARRQQAGASVYARQSAIQEKELIGAGIDPGVARSLAYERSQKARLDDERKLFERQQRDTAKRDAQYDMLKRRTEAYREVKAAGGTYADLQEKLNAIELQAKGHTAARAREQAAMNREYREGTRAMQGLNKEGNSWLKWSTSPLRIAGVVLMFQAIRTLQTALASLARYPLEMEKLRMGIVHSTGAAGRWVDTMGKALPAIDQIKLSIGEATEAQTLLTQQSIKYGVSIDGLVEGYKIAGGMLKAAGFSLEEAVDTTSQLTVISNAFGISQTQLSKTIDNIIKGYRVQQTQLGVILNLSTKEVRAAIQRGQLAELLNDRLAVTAEALRTINLDTFSGRLQSVITSVKEISSVVVGPMFDAASESLYRFMMLLGQVKAEHSDFFEKYGAYIAGAGGAAAGAVTGAAIGLLFPPAAPALIAGGAITGYLGGKYLGVRGQEIEAMQNRSLPQRAAMLEYQLQSTLDAYKANQELPAGLGGANIIEARNAAFAVARDLEKAGYGDQAARIKGLREKIEQGPLRFVGTPTPEEGTKGTKGTKGQFRGASMRDILRPYTIDIDRELAAIKASTTGMEARNNVLQATISLEQVLTGNRERLVQLTGESHTQEQALLAAEAKRIELEKERETRIRAGIEAEIQSGNSTVSLLELLERYNQSLNRTTELESDALGVEQRRIAQNIKFRESIENLTDAYIDFRDINKQVINDLLQGIALGTGNIKEIPKRYIQSVVGKVLQEQIDEAMPKGKPTTGIPKDLLKRGIGKIGELFGIEGQGAQTARLQAQGLSSDAIAALQGPGGALSGGGMAAGITSGALMGLSAGISLLAGAKNVSQLRNQGGVSKNDLTKALWGQVPIVGQITQALPKELGAAGTGALAGGMTGAALGFMVGGPIGALIGGGAGVVGGLLSGIFQQKKTTGTLIARNLEKILPELGIPAVGGPWKNRRTDILAQLGYPERGMAIPSDIGELGAYGRQAGLFYGQGAPKGRGQYDPNYIRNALLNTAAALRVTGEEAEKMIGKFTQAIAGKDMDEAILNFQKLHVEGKITNADFEQGIKGILEAYTDLPNVIDQARLAQELFTEDGRISMEALKRAIEDTASITEGISGALKSLAKDGNFIDAAQALGEAFGDTLLERLTERLLESDLLSKTLTEVSTMLTEAATARGLGDIDRANQLINEAANLYLKGQADITDVVAGFADVYRLFASNIGLQYGGGGSVRQMRVPSFQHGGIVPGPLGVPRLVVAHGGEKFSGGTDSMDKMNYHMGQMVSLLGQIARSTSERPIVQAVIDPVMLAKSQDKVITNRSYGLTTPNPSIGA